MCVSFRRRNEGVHRDLSPSITQKAALTPNAARQFHLYTLIYALRVSSRETIHVTFFKGVILV